MMGYIFRRLAYLALVVLGMSVIVFGFVRVLPGDPAVMAAGGADATPETIAHARKELGLDQPLPVQYSIYVRNIFTGNFGRSLATRHPIGEDLRSFLPATIELALAAVCISALLGIPLGIVAAVRADRWLDQLARSLSIFASSMPVYWLGLVAVLVFYRFLGFLPAGGRLSFGVTPAPFVTGLYTVDGLLAGDLRLFGDALRHLALPATVLSGISFGMIFNVTRASFLEVLKEPYINTARAKGLGELAVIAKHGLKNAAIPIVTVIGLQLGQLMGGVVLTETIFSWPGLGLYMVRAVDTLDYPIIMTCTLVYSLAYGILNFIVDLAYLALNPQITT
jgi:peptide/nickel transport system permease protein